MQNNYEAAVSIKVWTKIPNGKDFVFLNCKMDNLKEKHFKVIFWKTAFRRHFLQMTALTRITGAGNFRTLPNTT